jgi:hypothetical protein
MLRTTELALTGFLALAGCTSPEQSPSCKAFVACVRALDTQAGTLTDTARFEPDGDCWGNPDGAALCTTACARGTTKLKEQHPALACEVTP